MVEETARLAAARGRSSEVRRKRRPHAAL